MTNAEILSLLKRRAKVEARIQRNQEQLDKCTELVEADRSERFVLSREIEVVAGVALQVYRGPDKSWLISPLGDDLPNRTAYIAWSYESRRRGWSLTVRDGDWHDIFCGKQWKTKKAAWDAGVRWIVDETKPKLNGVGGTF